MTWKFDPKLPLTLQIQHRLRQDILTGTYAPGEQFPTVRQLAFEASVNPNTMQKALSGLEGEELLVSRGTVGRFVTEDTAVLDRARERMHSEYMAHVLAQARQMGISREKLLAFIQESEEDI